MKNKWLNREIAMKVFFICSIVSCTIFPLNAQTKIRGTVFSTDGKPLEHASVLLLNAKDSSLVKGTLTDMNGSYNIENIAEGNYLMSSAYTGFDPLFTNAFIVKAGMEKFEMEHIKLQQVKELSSVTVVAKKPMYEQKIDRLVINVAAAITFTGITALDVMERSPGVVVNRVNNSLSINGKNGVIFMINGKRNYMDFAGILILLAGMPSGSVERIEIITTPPANFDAEGNAGIINIVLKSNGNYGTNGSYTLTGGYTKGEQNSASFNINHRKGKINLFGNYSFYRSRLQQVWTNYHAVTNDMYLNENYSEDNRHALTWTHDVQAGIDYQVNKKTIIGGLLSANYRKWTMQSLNDAFVTINHHLDTSVNITNDELHTTLYYGANINFQHTFKPDEKITINADYLYYKDKNPSNYLNDYYDGTGSFLFRENVQSNKLTPLKFLIVAADYTKKISKKIDMEAGLKGTASLTNNDIGVASFTQNTWTKDTTLSGNHTIHESIGAAYTSFSAKLSEKTSLKFGLRYEYTHTLLGTELQKSIIDRNYGNLFPSFFFMHTIKDNSSVNFAYSRRIFRPGYGDLAPWVLFLDPKTFQTGNPYLQPQITDNVSASYTLKNKIVTLSYSYAAPTIIMQPVVDKTTNRLVRASANSKNSQSASIGFSLPFTVTKWWNMQNNITFLWQQFNSFFVTDIRTESKGFYLNTTQNFSLPKNFSISISSFYSSKFLWGYYVFKPSGSIDAGVQKKFGKKRSSLAFNVSNLISSFSVNNLTADFPSQNLVIRSKNIYGYTGFSLSFTHNFGNDKVQQKRDRATGAEDEKGRAY
ncbi:MAG: outer membrane beta-barrel protein [Panacibacter sp.]